jgi:hypothetical protein
VSCLKVTSGMRVSQVLAQSDILMVILTKASGRTSYRKETEKCFIRMDAYIQAHGNKANATAKER